jgi:hypothetical protein
VQLFSAGNSNDLCKCVATVKRRTFVSVVLILLMIIVIGFASESRSDAIRLNGQLHTVDVVGDSLSWQSEVSITDTLKREGYSESLAVNPGHSLATPWAQARLKRDLQSHTAGVIVVETASNDSARIAEGSLSVDSYRKLLDDLLKSASGRCVVLVNAKERVAPNYYSSSAAHLVNSVISTEALTHAHERIVDWNRDSQGHVAWFGPDLLHFSPGLPNTLTAATQPTGSKQTAGERAFSQALVAGVRSCAQRATPVRN